MSTRTITLPADQWEAILEVVQDHWDEGPPGEGWQGSRLSAASAALSTALAQPEPRGPDLTACDLLERFIDCFWDEQDAESYPNAAALVAQARTLLAQPEPEGVGDEEIEQEAIANADTDDEYRAFKRGAFFVQERISRPTIKPEVPPMPVPVAERPWEREGWCDAEQTCWAIGHRDRWERVYVLGRDWSNPTYTHLLPHHALPLPTPTP